VTAFSGIRVARKGGYERGGGESGGSIRRIVDAERVDSASYASRDCGMAVAGGRTATGPSAARIPASVSAHRSVRQSEGRPPQCMGQSAMPDPCRLALCMGQSVMAAGECSVAWVCRQHSPTGASITAESCPVSVSKVRALIRFRRTRMNTRTSGPNHSSRHQPRLGDVFRVRALVRLVTELLQANEDLGTTRTVYAPSMRPGISA
jgi:hypothetical protein